MKDKSLRKLDFSDKKNVKEDIIFKNKIGRIRDIQIHPSTGKIYFLSHNALWLMEKTKSDNNKNFKKKWFKCKPCNDLFKSINKC